MIVEALAHLTTRAAAGARETGLVYEQAALIGRFLRLRKTWRPHLANCRRVILAAADGLPRRGTAVVLGSGPLLDIPLSALAARFDRIVLIDAAHPLHARLIARRLGNVACMAASLVTLDSPAPRYRSWRPLVPGADLVIASMLVSQLPLLRRQETLPGTPWRAALVADALADIAGGDAATCVITETRRLRRDRSGAILAAEDPLFGVAPPPAAETWRWSMAPVGELAPDHAVELEVAASVGSR